MQRAIERATAWVVSAIQSAREDGFDGLVRRFRTSMKTWRLWLPYTISRWFVCLYFVNHGWTHLVDHWWRYDAIVFPWLAIPMIVVGVLVGCNVKVHIFSGPLVLFAFLDLVEILGYRIYRWIYSGETLYINELMAKKFSMLGASVMLLINDPSFKQTIDRAQGALRGLILQDDGADDDHAVRRLIAPSLSAATRQNVRVSGRTSAVLLAVRLLIATFFIFVGFGEIKRQIAGALSAGNGGQRYQRPPGDGHDQLWLKVVEFTLAIPFAVGFKTRITSALLALSLVIESLVYWRWRSAASVALGIGYSLHARDHFYTNLGGAGGLFLLQSFGPGQYSVDEIIRKKDS